MAANDVPCCETMFWVYLIISVALVAFAGLMSGLTLGLMSLSVLDLEVLAKAGQPKDRKNAAKILPVVKNQHLLLCTLLICNAMAMEALPVFLDSLLLEWCSILISVTLILTFGEIILQAVCSRYGLSVGAKLSVFVHVLVIVVFPIAYPISKLLDLILGKGHSVLLRRAELKTYVDMHGNEAGKGGELTHDETTIIKGALDLTQMTAKDAMTPVSDIFSLNLNSKLNDEAMSLILRKGHSRVPVYSGKPENIIGIIPVKNLIKCRPEDETPIRNLTIRQNPRVHDFLPLYAILNLFQKGHCHMAVVVKSKGNLSNTAENGTVKININLNTIHCQAEQREIDYQNTSSVTSSETDTRSPSSDGKIRNDVLDSLPNLEDEEIVGLITMEDVLEQLLQEPIFDETDDYVDIHNNSIQVNMLPALRSLGATSGSKYYSCRNLAVSPISSSASCTSYHLTPVLRSPLSPFIPSPIIRPTLSASPLYSTPNSPAGHISSSRSSHRKQEELFGMRNGIREDHFDMEYPEKHTRSCRSLVVICRGLLFNKNIMDTLYLGISTGS